MGDILGQVVCGIIVKEGLVPRLDPAGSGWVPVARCYVYGNVFARCIRGWEFLRPLRGRHFYKEDYI